jgi:hypothetical protein
MDLWRRQKADSQLLIKRTAMDISCIRVATAPFRVLLQVKKNRPFATRENLSCAQAMQPLTS